jgi:phospholipid/cholesterol/gamma-HCH transport system substrate-binding protein
LEATGGQGARGATAPRIIAVAALLIGVLACVLLLGGGGGQRLVLSFDNASQLVKGDLVKVGGIPVGKVT